MTPMCLVVWAVATVTTQRWSDATAVGKGWSVGKEGDEAAGIPCEFAKETPSHPDLTGRRGYQEDSGSTWCRRHIVPMCRRRVVWCQGVSCEVASSRGASQRVRWHGGGRRTHVRVKHSYKG
jgi:hypothetical protein